MKLILKTFLLFIFIMIGLFLFKEQSWAQETCSWDDGHHVCYSEVGCTVGQPCNAPACQCFSDGSPDGYYCGRISNCNTHCDGCGGGSEDSNCCFLQYCECGCACAGCCGDPGGSGGNKFNVVIIAEDDESSHWGKEEDGCGREWAKPECINKYCGITEQGCPNPFFVGNGHESEDTHIGITRYDNALSYSSCQYWATWAQDTGEGQAGELVEGESGIGCDAYFKLYGYAGSSAIKNIYFKLTGGETRIEGQVFSRNALGNPVYWKGWTPGHQAWCDEGGKYGCDSPYNCSNWQALNVDCQPKPDSNAADWFCDDIISGTSTEFPYWREKVGWFDEVTCTVENLPEVGGVQYGCVDPPDCQITHTIDKNNRDYLNWLFEIGPVGGLSGRVFYDANRNGVNDDGVYNSGIQHSSYACGSYLTQNGINIAWSGGATSDDSVLVNTINGNSAACQPQPYYSQDLGQGDYDIYITGLPTNWEVTAMNGGSNVDLVTGSCEVTIGSGTTSLSIGVAEKQSSIAGTAYNMSAYSSQGAAAYACRSGGSFDTVAGVDINCTSGSCGSGTSRTTGGDGTYAFSDLNLGSYNLVASISNPDWNSVFFCDSATAGQTVNLSSSDVTANIGVIQGVMAGWWQASIGDVHADSSGGGEVIDSVIPDSCLDLETCDAFVLTNSEDDEQKGLMTHTSGSVDSGGGDDTESNWELTSDYTGDLTDYDYFYSLAQDYDVLPEEEWAGDEPTEAVNYVWSDDTTINLDEAWLENYGHKAVFYFGGTEADNDVTLNIESDVTLASGAFLAFIVDGDVSIAENVADFEGVIITDGTIIVDTTSSNDDVQFNGQGIFVAWTGFSLGRNLGFNADGGDNRDTPAELFTYSPELMFTAPPALKKPNYTWVEVTP